MFRNFLIIALRNFRRNKFFTLINVMGLALGMAVTLLIMEYILQELSYDRFHEQKDDIYRVIVKEEKEGAITPTAFITAAVAPSMKDEFHDVEHRSCGMENRCPALGRTAHDLTHETILTITFLQRRK